MLIHQYAVTILPNIHDEYEHSTLQEKGRGSRRGEGEGLETQTRLKSPVCLPMIKYMYDYYHHFFVVLYIIVILLI